MGRGSEKKEGGHKQIYGGRGEGRAMGVITSQKSVEEF